MSYHTRKVEIPVEKPMLYQKCGNCNNPIELNCGLKVVFVKENGCDNRIIFIMTKSFFRKYEYMYDEYFDCYT